LAGRFVAGPPGRPLGARGAPLVASGRLPAQCDAAHSDAASHHGIVLFVTGGDSMFVIDALLVLAMLFFLFLPITDRRTARMKLYVLCALLAVFTASVTRGHTPHIELAGVVSTR
jgi:hypothetical protein